MKFFVAWLLVFGLAGCAGKADNSGSYLRVSQGTYVAKIWQWLGLAAEGGYCQISSNEEDYEWTSEDLTFFSQECGSDSERVALIQAFLDSAQE